MTEVCTFNLHLSLGKQGFITTSCGPEVDYAEGPRLTRGPISSPCQVPLYLTLKVVRDPYGSCEAEEEMKQEGKSPSLLP